MHRKNQLTSPKQLSTVGSENWWLVDESSGGFAVDLGKEVSNWVEAGKLVGYTSPEDKDVFFIAEIKSVRKQADGTYRAGLQLMADNGVALQISRVEKESPSEVVSGYFVDEENGNNIHFKTFEALLMKDDVDDASTRMTLIMPRIEYKRRSQYRITIDGDDKVIEVGRVLSKQRDWICVDVLI